MNSPKVTYGNDPCLYDVVDPNENTADIYSIVGNCFKLNVVLKWLNTKTRDLFFLYNVLNPVYNEEGGLISGDLIWAKYNVTVIQS